MSQEKSTKSLKGIRSNIKSLTETEKRILDSIEKGVHISRNPRTHPPQLSFGQRMADKLASFGGSWTFILVFLFVVTLWILLNSAFLGQGANAFDPFPFILLNLFLSLLATLQAPVILMTQKRQDEKDRAAAFHDYEINLKAELEIMSLHEKLDTLMQATLKDMLAMQAEQGKTLASIEESLKSLATRNDQA